MDTTKEEREAWREKLVAEVKRPCMDLGTVFCGADIHRLLDDAERCRSMEAVVEYLQSMPQDALTREDLMLMMANSAQSLVECRHEVAALAADLAKHKSQIYRMELEGKDRKKS